MKSRLVSLNGLDDQTYQWIRDSGNLLAEVTGAKRVLLFGSLARGGGNRDSDADFCFIVPNGTDLREVGMAAQLAFLHRCRCMDFFTLKNLTICQARPSWLVRSGAVASLFFLKILLNECPIQE